MFRDYKITIGLVPIRRDMFPDPKDALANKNKILPKVIELLQSIHDVEIVDIEWLNEEGMLVENDDVAKVEAHFRNAGVDAIFAPHFNFGQEEVVAKLGKAMGKPFLLWGPRDEEPRAGFMQRQTDTQCGLFASGKALSRYGVNFTYIENCWVDSPVLKEGLEKFIRVASVVKDIKGLRVGQISLRPRQFLSVMANEDELLEKFGIEIVPINAYETQIEIENVFKNKKDEIKEWIKDTTDEVNCSTITPQQLEKMAALEIAIMQIAKKYSCKAMAGECWTIFRNNLGVAPCFVYGNLTEKGLPVTCETDLHGAISSAMLAAAARGETPIFLADVTIRHPEKDNAELLWHCGPFPKSLAKDSSQRELVECHGQWEIKGGDITVARFDAVGGKYKLFAGEAVGTDGPSTNGNYVWIETDNWPEWEKKLVYGPYVHHVAGIHGKFTSVLDEACKYLGDIEKDFM